VTTDDALLELGRSTAAAVAGALETFLPGAVEVGEPAVVPAGTAPAAGVPLPAVAAEVSFTGGASGGNVLVGTLPAARALAAAVGGPATRDPDDVDPGAPLDAGERRALADAVDACMAAAAAATSTVLGDDVEVSATELRDLATEAAAQAIGESAPHTTRVPLVLAGAPCVLVQLVPRAFVVRMTRALDDRLASDLDAEARERAGAGDGEDAADAILRGVGLRVSAEIGRAELPIGDAVAVPPGGVLELDRAADDPIDLLVNGRRFATGRLVLVDGEWAVRIEEVLEDLSALPVSTLTTVERGGT